MRDPDRPRDDETDHDDLLARLSAGGAGIRPRPDAPIVLGRAVARDQRRRHTRSLVLSTAAAVVVGVVATSVVLSTGATRGPQPAAPSSTDGSTPPEVTASRPASLFQVGVGGRSRGKTIRYHLVQGERLNAQFDWWPEEVGGPGPYLAGVAVENYAEATDDCTALVVGGSDCVTRDDGVRLTTYDVPLADASFDPVHRAAGFDGPADPAAVVRGVTYLYPTGIAVTAFVCACSPDGTPEAAGAPLSYDDLERVAADPAWVEGRRTR